MSASPVRQASRSITAAGEYAEGKYRRHFTLASGRFAMIDNGLGFRRVPWAPFLEKQLGHHVSGLARDGGGVDWVLGEGGDWAMRARDYRLQPCQLGLFGRIFLAALRVSASRSLAISAYLTRAPQPGPVWTLVDKEPTTAASLAASNSSRVCRRQNGGQRPQQRPKWLADVTPRKVMQKHSTTLNKARLRRSLSEKAIYET